MRSPRVLHPLPRLLLLVTVAGLLPATHAGAAIASATVSVEQNRVVYRGADDEADRVLVNRRAVEGVDRIVIKPLPSADTRVSAGTGCSEDIVAGEVRCPALRVDIQ